jgi:hypothetical protein
MNTKQLQQAFVTLSVIVLFSSGAISASAKEKEEFNTNEVEKITQIVKQPDLNKRKDKIKQELDNKNNSPKYKEFISTKIAVESERVVKNTTNFTSKYESKAKNYSCWDGTGYELVRAWAGNWLFRYNLRISACADYSRIYNGFIRGTWGDIYSPGWAYYGDTGDRRFDYINWGASEYIASRQGLFKLCINNNWSCVNESRPWVEYHATRQGYADYWY